MELQSSNQQQCCYPFCCLGTIDPFKVILGGICWDFFLLFCWFVLNLFKANQISYGPLILNFIYIVGLFFIMYNLFDKKKKFSVVKYYSYFRVGAAVFMTFFTFGMFVMIIVFSIAPKLNNPIINRTWAIGLVLFFIPATTVHWGTVFGIRRALKLMKSVPLSELVTKPNSTTSGMYGTLIVNPKKEWTLTPNHQLMP